MDGKRGACPTIILQQQRHTALAFFKTHALVSAPFMSIWNYANPQLRELEVYEPGKPIEDVARELGLKPNEIIKLASNENPLGPSPKALDAMREALERAHFYPDGGGYYLREAI